MTWYQKFFKKSAIGEFKYVLPKDKEFLMFDFYALSMMIPLSTKAKIRTGDFEYEMETPTYFHREEDYLDYSIEQAQNQLLPFLRKDLLEAVFFSICAETRHIYDHNGPDKVLNIVKGLTDNKEIIEQFKDYTTKYQFYLKNEKFAPRSKDRITENPLSTGYVFSFQSAISSFKKREDFVLLAGDLFVSKDIGWSGGFGGKKWKDIADGWLMLYYTKDKKKDELITYIDHVYDLQHNTSTVFNKVSAYLKGSKDINKPEDPYKKPETSKSGGKSFNWVLKALDFKKHIRNPYELYGNMSYGMQKMFAYYMFAKSGETLEEFLKNKGSYDKKAETGKKDLFEAVKTGDLNKVKEIIGKSNNLLHEVSNTGGKSALIYAVMEDKLEIAKYLVEAGISVNLQDKDGKSALIHAAMKKNKDIFQFLINNNADPDAEDNEHKTAYTYWPESKEIIVGSPLNVMPNKEIIDSAIDKLKEKKDEKEFNEAIINKDKKEIDAAIDIGMKADMYSLDLAIGTGDIDIIKKVISIGAKPNSMSLIKAEQTGNQEIINLIKNLGKDESQIDISDESNKEIIKLINSGNTEGLKEFLNIHNKINDIFIPVNYIIKNYTSILLKNINVLEFLVKEMGADINIPISSNSPNILTYYLRAYGVIDIDIIEKLLYLGSDVNKNDGNKDNSAYNYAVSQQKSDPQKFTEIFNLFEQYKDKNKDKKVKQGKNPILPDYYDKNKETYQKQKEYVKISDLSSEEQDELLYYVTNNDNNGLYNFIKNKNINPNEAIQRYVDLLPTKLYILGTLVNSLKGDINTPINAIAPNFISYYLQHTLPVVLTDVQYLLDLGADPFKYEGTSAGNAAYSIAQAKNNKDVVKLFEEYKKATGLESDNETELSQDEWDNLASLIANNDSDGVYEFTEKHNIHPNIVIQKYANILITRLGVLKTLADEGNINIAIDNNCPNILSYYMKNAIIVSMDTINYLLGLGADPFVYVGGYDKDAYENEPDKNSAFKIAQEKNLQQIVQLFKDYYQENKEKEQKEMPEDMKFDLSKNGEIIDLLTNKGNDELKRYMDYAIIPPDYFISHYADIMLNYTDILNYLVKEEGAAINVPIMSGGKYNYNRNINILLFSILENIKFNKNIWATLLKLGADPYQKDDTGESAYSVLIKQDISDQQQELIKLIEEYKPQGIYDSSKQPVTENDKILTNQLDEALSEKFTISYIKVLIDKGAKPSGKTLDYALEYKDEYLIKRVITIDAKPSKISLIPAVQTGNMDIIKTIAEVYKQHNIPIEQETLNNSLQIAIKINSIDIVKYIISLGVIPDEYNLGKAKEIGNKTIIDLVEKAIEHPVKEKTGVDKYLNSELNNAIKNEDVNLIIYILNKGIKPDTASLNFALITKHYDVINLIIESDPLPNKESLYHAIQTKNKNIVHDIYNLTVKKIKLNQSDLNRYLGNAVDIDDLGITQMMYNLGGKPNEYTLTAAHKTGNQEMVDLINSFFKDMTSDVKFNKNNIFEELYNSITDKNNEKFNAIVKYAFDNKINIPLTTEIPNIGYSLLFISVMAKNMYAFDYIVHHDYNAMSPIDKKGNNILHWAVNYHNMEIIDLVAEKKLNFLDTFDNEGLTPLMLAVRKGNKEEVLAVLKTNPLIIRKNKEGKNALKLAEELNLPEIVQILKNKLKEMPVNMFDFMVTQLQLGNWKYLNRLIKNIDINKPYQSEWGAEMTLLDKMIEKKNLPAVKFLVENGANVNSITTEPTNEELYNYLKSKGLT
ncbi:MAG: ankyrin repeat domain-containing protein [Nanoarchaeota archaeon]